LSLILCIRLLNSTEDLNFFQQYQTMKFIAIVLIVSLAVALADKDNSTASGQPGHGGHGHGHGHHGGKPPAG
jgi:hypothetical protein